MGKYGQRRNGCMDGESRTKHPDHDSSQTKIEKFLRLCTSKVGGDPGLDLRSLDANSGCAMRGGGGWSQERGKDWTTKRKDLRPGLTDAGLNGKTETAHLQETVSEVMKTSEWTSSEVDGVLG
ncbi:hypothetical protein CISG_03279 [Coccidioides immitis RMSCC 3703]|uniref:Uncharacterized protein n=2 Tax=Coccidioides immitis TaxID=5501 RepID=A0A0J8QK77_COCIT|nr:hypothetical protein CIRG_01061 [Coccidioides immitis RMSCC 2394]KMU72845.1 hypothetical protein CISG_03279 [Coccidioides immitis RMSCC 3703]